MAAWTREVGDGVGHERPEHRRIARRADELADLVVGVSIDPDKECTQHWSKRR